ncbi:IclR family transcriptional regulator [Salinigranum halophilum]|jgi:DNA-binding IclR family transcriptional regulator|uniref:IclR family transcriptional regulator n=1 Tax=Salinigranum halophilum TaxID=2565931 RepID=UPI0010A921EE|nr:IclR family transcriptional regulator [Salinigranum halophilum]
MERDHDADGLIGAVDTTLRIVETLNDIGTAGVTQLARQLDEPKSTVYNHLDTLNRRGYVVKTDDQYRLACRFLELGSMTRERYLVYRIARDEVTALAEGTGELAGLVVEEHGYGVFLHRAKGDQAVHVDTHVGKRIHLHGAALGKAMLAFSSDDHVQEVIDWRGLPALTDHTITDADALAEELGKIREEGVAFDDEERINGLRSVAVPLRTDDGDVLGAISVAGPTSRLRGDRFQSELPDQLRSAANVIELNITYL